MLQDLSLPQDGHVFCVAASLRPFACADDAQVFRRFLFFTQERQQLSDFVIGLERNGQAEDPVERNTTHIRVLKNRFSGITGPAGHLLYDNETGRQHEHEPVEEDDVL